ncbi:putative ATP-dependent RNA helicase TDRD12 isoform X2 [Sitodiplosis mosellana]|nr:putative ATP-dependent RNA helicase TDRD12 isoform X2 [Sitodiplosis mosellana]
MKKMNLQETYLIQGYAWPNLLRGNSMILVDSQNRGKTMAYLPALCSMVQREFENAEAERGDKNKPRSKMGATAIIVCLTSNVKKIADDCRTILQMPSFKSNVVEAIGTRDAVSVTVKLYNGCNILVATAPCLVDLITKSEHIFKSDRLKCIAFENLDCIMEKQPDIVNFIVKNLCSRKSYKGGMRQFIVTSRTWQSTLLKFMNERDVADSVLVIGNYLEAAFCAGVLMHFRLCKNEVKLDILTEHIQTISYRTERTMVVCNSSTEAEQVTKHLDSKNIPYEWAKDIESNYAQAKIKSFWGKVEGILICTDAHLPGLEIKNVQHILHFSVPTKEFRSFLSRHSTLLDFYDEGRNKEKATSTIFLDDDNFAQLPKLVELLTRDGQQVPKQVMELSQSARMMNKRDKAKKQRFQSICNFVFMHGVTEHQAMCSHRHLLLPSDILDDSEPMASGHLRFNVLKIISPTEYIVRPTELKAGEHGTWRTINNSDEFDDVNAKMQAYYKDTINQKVLHTLELGQKCVVQCHEIFYRAEIIEIYEKRKVTDVDIFEVRFIDTGEVERRNAFEIFTLDEQFQALPNQAYHLHLTSIIPADKEDDWDPCLCEKVRQYLSELNANDNDSIYEATIVFTLRNTIIVDVMRLTGLKRGIIHCSIKSYLQRRKYAISSSASRDKVVEMAKAVGVKIIAESPPKVNPTSEPSAKANINSKVGNEKETTYSRNESSDALISFDDSGSESISQDESTDKWECPWKIQHKSVIISQFNSPNDFYVVLQSEKRKQMYDTISEHMTNTSFNDSMGCPDVYKYCLVLVADGYERAKVIEVIYGEDIQLKVFLVDTGFCPIVDISNVYDIPDNLIQMLPFQAIWCNLVGIKPAENAGCEVAQWNEQHIDAIYEAIDGYGNDLVLHTVSTDKSVKSKIADTNFVRHDIVLLAIPDEDQQINMNQLLVAQELADFDPSTRHSLDNVPILVSDDNDDDSESDWDDECKAYGNEQQKKWVMVDNPPNRTESPESDISNDFEKINELLNDDSFMQEAEDFLRDLCKSNKEGGEQNGTEPEIEQKSAMKVDDSTIKPQMESKSKIEWNNNKLDNGYASTSNGSSEGSENSTDCQIENSSEDSGNPGDRHQLEYVYKRPRVFWWQTDEMIVLKISAHDNVKYGLEVTSEQLVYGTIENDEKIVAIIHFFGCVDYKLTTHELRGVYVVVRLRKSCPIKWPRLQHTAQKCTWVVQNIDAFKSEEFYDDAIEKLEKIKIDSDSDEESNDNVVPAGAHLDLEDDDDSFDEHSE